MRAQGTNSSDRARDDDGEFRFTRNKRGYVPKQAVPDKNEK